MDKKRADDLGERICLLIHDRPEEAQAVLNSILVQRTALRYLERIGSKLGTNPLSILEPHLDCRRRP
jgi:hypothetical protein